MEYIHMWNWQWNGAHMTSGRSPHPFRLFTQMKASRVINDRQSRLPLTRWKGSKYTPGTSPLTRDLIFISRKDKGEGAFFAQRELLRPSVYTCLKAGRILKGARLYLWYSRAESLFASRHVYAILLRKWKSQTIFYTIIHIIILNILPENNFISSFQRKIFKNTAK